MFPEEERPRRQNDESGEGGGSDDGDDGMRELLVVPADKETHDSGQRQDHL